MYVCVYVHVHVYIKYMIFLIHKDALDNGKVNPRSSLGGMFRTELQDMTEAQQSEYKTMDRKEAAAFRVQWLQGKYQKAVESRSESTSWQRVDKTNGEYLSLGAMIQRDGGWSDPHSVRGALTCAQKCTAMGGDWVMRHPQTNRMHYLCLRFGFSEEFTTAWEKKVEHINSGEQSGSAVEGTGKGTGKGGGKSLAIKEKKGGDRSDGSATATCKDKEKGKLGTARQGDGDMKTAIKTCNAIKADFLKHGGLAIELIKMIDQAEPKSKWAWAKNDENRGELHGAASTLNRDMEAGNNRALMTEDIAQFAKKQTDKNELMEDLLEFQKLAGKVKTLKNVMATMHKRSVA
jgi:hypothetical protein